MANYNPYATHVIIPNPTSPDDPNRLFLRRNDGGSEYWVEFVLGARGTLIVHGDGPDLVFRRWHDTTLRTELAMLAEGGDYARAKIVLGDALVWDDEDAQVQVMDWLIEEAEENHDAAEPLPLERAIDIATMQLGDMSIDWDHGEHSVKHQLHEHRPDWWEELGPLGMVESPDFKLAVLAARRAVELLDAERLPFG